MPEARSHPWLINIKEQRELANQIGSLQEKLIGLTSESSTNSWQGKSSCCASVGDMHFRTCWAAQEVLCTHVYLACSY